MRYILLFLFIGSSSIASAELSDSEMKEAMANYERYQTLSPEQKQSIQQNWKRYQGMSATDRAKIDARSRAFESLKPERKKWLVARADARKHRSFKPKSMPKRHRRR